MDKEAIATAATKVTYAGGGGAFYFGLTANQLAAFGGLLIAAIGLVVSTWFKHQYRKDLLAHHRKIEEKK